MRTLPNFFSILGSCKGRSREQGGHQGSQVQCQGKCKGGGEGLSVQAGQPVGMLCPPAGHIRATSKFPGPAQGPGSLVQLMSQLLSPPRLGARVVGRAGEWPWRGTRQRVLTALPPLLLCASSKAALFILLGSFQQQQRWILRKEVNTVRLPHFATHPQCLMRADFSPSAHCMHFQPSTLPWSTGVRELAWATQHVSMRSSGNGTSGEHCCNAAVSSLESLSVLDPPKAVYWHF